MKMVEAVEVLASRLTNGLVQPEFGGVSDFVLFLNYADFAPDYIVRWTDEELVRAYTVVADAKQLIVGSNEHGWQWRSIIEIGANAGYINGLIDSEIPLQLTNQTVFLGGLLIILRESNPSADEINSLAAVIDHLGFDVVRRLILFNVPLEHLINISSDDIDPTLFLSTWRGVNV